MKTFLSCIFLSLFLGSNLYSQFIELDCGITVEETTVGSNSNYNSFTYAPCADEDPSKPYNAGDKAFRITLTERTVFSVSMFNEGDINLDLFLFDGEFRFCIRSTNARSDDGFQQEAFGGGSLPAGIYILVVDGFQPDQEDDFRITFNCGPLDCTAPTEIQCGEVLSNENNLGAPNNVGAVVYNDDLKNGFTGPERLYNFVLNEASDIQIDLDNFASDDNFELFLLDDQCDELNVLAISENEAGIAERINASLDPGEYYILVDGFDGTTGSYDLRLDGTCKDIVEEGPIDIACGQTLDGTTIAYESNFSGGDYFDCIGPISTDYNSPDALYKFTLDEAQTVEIDLNYPDELMNFEFFLLESDNAAGPDNPMPGNCIATGGPKEKGAYLLKNLEKGTYWISIDNARLFSPEPLPTEGDFSLSLNCFELSRPCDLEGAYIADGTLQTGTFFEAQVGPFFGIPCMGDFGIEDKLFYKSFTYYSESSKTTTFDLSSSDSELRIFVFDCSIAERENSCIGSSNANTPLSLETTVGKYYQIIVAKLSEGNSVSYQLSIPNPVASCHYDLIGSGLDPLATYDTVVSGIPYTLEGYGNDFDTLRNDFYQNCGGTVDVPFTGQDRIILYYFGTLGQNAQISYEIDENGDLLTYYAAEFISLECFESTSAMSFYIFDYQCDFANCIAYLEIPEGGGQVCFDHTFLEPGTYYVLVDKPTDEGSNFFFSSPSQIASPQECIDGATNHDISFSDGILNRQGIFEEGDELFIDYVNKDYLKGLYYEPLVLISSNTNWNTDGNIAGTRLLQQEILTGDPNPEEDVIGFYCGFLPNEEFIFKVKKPNGKILVLEPQFDDFISIGHDPDVFTPGGNSLITNFKLRDARTIDEVAFQPLGVDISSIDGDGRTFRAHIDANRGWGIQKSPQFPWINIVESENNNTEVNTGFGRKQVVINIDENPGATDRVGFFTISSEGGQGKQVSIQQLIKAPQSIIAEDTLTISCGETIEGSTIGLNNDFGIPEYEDCLPELITSNFSGADALYRFELTEAQLVEIDLDIITEDLNLRVVLLESDYTQGDDNPQPGNCISLGTILENGGAIFEKLLPGTYWISVDYEERGQFFPPPPTEGNFSLNLNCFELSEPCDLNGPYIKQGNEFLESRITDFEATPLFGVNCFEDFYDFDEVSGTVYSYYSEASQSVPFEFNTFSGDIAYRLFIVDCSATDRATSCIAEISANSGPVNMMMKENTYYQIIILATTFLDVFYSTTTDFSIHIPDEQNACNEIDFKLQKNQLIEGRFGGFENDFDTASHQFYDNCGQGIANYDGEDVLLQFFIEPEFRYFNYELNTSLKDNARSNPGFLRLRSNTATGMFLFNYQCGEETCIASIELPPEGGDTTLALSDLELDEGNYYILIDRATTEGLDSFKLEWEANDGNIICSESTSTTTHSISFKPRILENLSFFEEGDQLFVDFSQKPFLGEILYDNFRYTAFFKNEDYLACLEQPLINSYFGPDATYQFELSTSKAVSINLDVLTDQLFLRLFLFDSDYSDGPDAPKPGNCIAVGNYLNEFTGNAIWERLPPGTYWVIVDHEMGGTSIPPPPSEGNFSLSLQCFDLSTPCDLSGKFLIDGTNFTVKDGLDFNQFRSEAFFGLNCFDPDLTASANVVAAAYSYYSEHTQTTGFNLSSPSDDTHIYIMDCSIPNREELCIAEQAANLGVLNVNTLAGQYYQVIIIGDAQSEFSLSLSDPNNTCGNDIPSFFDPSISGPISFSVEGFGNDFDTNTASFYDNCIESDATYEGEDRVIQFELRDKKNDFSIINYEDQGDLNKTIEGDGWLELTSESPMSFFLFNNQCGAEECIDAVELLGSEEDGYFGILFFTALPEGRYYLIADKPTTMGSDSFSIWLRFKDNNVDSCPGLFQGHTVSFSDGILNRQDILEPGDQLYVEHASKTDIGEIYYATNTLVTEEGFANASGNIEDYILLGQNSGSLDIRCGFSGGEEFVFKVLKQDGSILVLDPVFDDFVSPPTGPTIWAFNGRTLVKDLRLRNSITYFKVDFKPDNFKLHALRITSEGAGTDFKAHIDVSKDWTISKAPEDNWYRILDINGGEEITQGSGPTRVRFEVSPNSTGAPRTGVFSIIGENGEGKQFSVFQEHDACADVQLEINSTVTPVTCIDENDGSIEVLIANDEGFTYEWDDGTLGPIRTDLSPQVYQVTITTPSLCTFIETYNITEADLPLDFELNLSDTVICSGQTTSASVSVSGGVPDYIITWIGNGTGPDIDNLTPGLHTITVEDANGCLLMKSFNIDTFPSLNPLIEGDTLLCFGDTSTLSLSETYVSYNWSTESNDSTITVTTSGFYSVTVTDNMGCEGIDTIEVIIKEELVPEITGEAMLCFGASTTLSLTQDFASYNWSTES